MKQLIFVSIALIFITSLLPANLSSQVILGDDPPEIDLGVPWDHPETQSINLDDNHSGEEKHKEESCWEQKLIRSIFQLNLILNKR